MDRPQPIDPKMHWNRIADAVQRYSGPERRFGPVPEEEFDPDRFLDGQQTTIKTPTLQRRPLRPPAILLAAVPDRRPLSGHRRGDLARDVAKDAVARKPRDGATLLWRWGAPEVVLPSLIGSPIRSINNSD